MTSIGAVDATDEPAATNWQESVERANEKSLVFIKAIAILKDDEDLKEESYGTGFVVHKDGYVLTCSHVVPAKAPKFKSVKVTGALGSRYEHEYPLREIARDEQSDLLLLRLSKSTWRSVKSAALVGLGAEILSLGFPLQQDLTTVPGTLTNMNSDTGRWLTNTALNHGMSGGPVFDKFGRVVAVVRAGHEEAQSLNELIPITIATSLLQKIDSPLLPIAAGKPAPTSTPKASPTPKATSTPSPNPPTPKPAPSARGKKYLEDPDISTYWDGDSVRGSASIVVHLEKQAAYFYKDRQLVGMSKISSGRPEWPTPKGDFKIVEKVKDSRSPRFGDYVDKDGNVVKEYVDKETDPMPKGTIFRGGIEPYFMRLFDHLGFHAGYLPGYNSAVDGCIKMPEFMAENFFKAAPIGTPVLITD